MTKERLQQIIKCWERRLKTAREEYAEAQEKGNWTTTTYLAAEINTMKYLLSELKEEE